MKSEIRSKAAGSALIYILIAIAMLAILTAALIEPGSQQAQTQSGSNLISTFQSQISMIRAAIQECVITHPDQDSELSSVQQKNRPYPINPWDPYYTAQGAVPGVAPDNLVQYLRCPGNPGGTGPTNQNHAAIFGSLAGKFFPPAPAPFGDWKYYNGADGVFIYATTGATDSYILPSLQKLDALYSPCEADIIDGTLSNVPISSDIIPGGAAVRSCGPGKICFRYWIVQKATAVGAGAGCP